MGWRAACWGLLPYRAKGPSYILPADPEADPAVPMQGTTSLSP